MRGKRFWLILLSVSAGVLGVLLLVGALGVLFFRPRTERDPSRLVVQLPAPPGASISLDGFTADKRQLIITAQMLTPPDKVYCRTWLLDLRTRRLKRIYQGGVHPVPNAVWKNNILFSGGDALLWVGVDGKVEEPFYRAPRTQAVRGAVISKREQIAFYLTSGRLLTELSNVWLIEPDRKNLRPLTQYTSTDRWSLHHYQPLMWSPEGDKLAFFEFSVVTTARGRQGVSRLVLCHLASGKRERLQQRALPWARWRWQVVGRKAYVGIVRRKGAKEEFVPISEVRWKPRQIPRGGKVSPDQRKMLHFLEDNPDALASPQPPWWQQAIQRLTGGRVSPRLMTRPPLPWAEAFYETSQLWLLTDDGRRRLLVKKYQNPLWSPDSQRVYFTRRNEVRVVEME